MDIRFFSHAKRPNSTGRPDLSTGALYDNIQLRGPCSIMSPVIDIRMQAGADPVGYNYAYIPAFERFYFVNDWQNDGYLWTCYLVEDELATWRTAIGNSTQYILRSSYDFDGDIRDEFYPAKAGTTSHVTVADIYTTDISNGYYVVGVINKDAATTAGNMGCVKYYVFTSAGLRSFMGKLFASASFTGFDDATDQTNLSDDVYKSIFNPIEYVTSCMFLPFKPATLSSVTDLSYGYWSLSGVTGCEELDLHGLPGVNSYLNTPRHPQAGTRGNYLNMAPYTRYTLYVQPFGQFPIDTTTVNSVDRIYYKIVVDPVSGQGVLELSLDANYSAVFHSASAQVGVPIALAQMSRDYVGGITSAVGGAAGALTSGLMGNVIGAVAGGLSAIGNVAASLLPQLTSKGANGSFIALTRDMVLLAEFLPLVDEDNADCGRPLCRKGTISDYPGYLVIADPDISILEANRQEMEAIRTYMSTGFFYE